MFDYEDASKQVEYNKETGVFTRLRDNTGITCKTSKYFCIRRKNKLYYLYRLDWYIIHKEVPLVIDHINGNREDNRFCNLRNVTYTENSRNLPKQSNNTSGITGVSWRSSCCKWEVYYHEKGRKNFVSYETTLVDAYIKRKGVKGFHTNHGRSV